MYKHGKTWYVDVVINGQRINRKGGNKAEAQAIENEIRRLHRLGTYNIEEC